MNRLHHLKKTLIQNIEDNLSYPGVEFVILDYNSSDGLEEWIKKDLGSYLKSNILKFYRTSEPVFFDRSHSRNLMFKLTSGDIICNMDADNYTGKDFAATINEVFNKENNIFFVADTQKRYYFLRNAFGRFCVRRNDYMELGGLDEDMKSYGSETLDFYERLSIAGKKEVIIENTVFLKTISHGDEERISNEFFLKSLEYFFIQYISYEESEILFLYKDGSFENGIIIPERFQTYLPACLKPGTLRKGNWIQEENNLHLEFTKGPKMSFVFEKDNLVESTSSQLKYALVDDPRFLMEAAKNYAFITNNQKLQENKKQQKVRVNELLFGKGIVYKNFEEKLIVN